MSTKQVEYVYLLVLDVWQRFVATSDSMLGLILRWFASLNTACKCSSVSRVRRAVLLIFIVEKNCSQTYVLPNIASIRRACESNFGNLSSETY